MSPLRYIEDVVTLKLDREKCTGCRVCLDVCPHGVFRIAEDRRAEIVDLGACMECGACQKNCAWNAIDLKPGVGCATAIINSWITGNPPSCGCSDDGDGGGCC